MIFGRGLMNALSAIGTLTAFYYLYRLYGLIHHFVRPSSLSRYLHKGTKGDEPWALVTGASDGIGLGFVHELLHRGFNVILHGRNKSKLDNIQRNLSSSYPNRTRIVIADASLTGAEAITQIERIAADVSTLNLTVLVNNVAGGVGDRQYLPFVERTLTEVAEQMACNEGFPTLLTRALLPQLIKNKPGLVLNIGSVLSKWPCSYLEPYCGTKGHNAMLNLALRTEMREEKHDVEFLHIQVFSVATMGSREELSGITVTPKTMARGALDKVGCAESTTMGCLRHVLASTVMDMVPEKVLGKALSAATRGKIVK